MKRNYFLMFDYLLILVVLLLVTIGILFIYSSGINADGLLVTTEYKKQIVWASIGFLFMLVLTIYDYRKFKKIALILYVVMVLVLLLTLLFGTYVNGATSWIRIGSVGLQPSEISKLIFILFLSSFLAGNEEMNEFKRFLISLIILFIPLSLILLQPDLGTAVVYIPIFLLICFFANVPLRYLFFIIGLGGLSVILTILPIWNKEIAEKSISIIELLEKDNIRVILIIIFSLLSITGLIIHKYFHPCPKYIQVISIISIIFTLSLCFSYVLGKVLKDYQIKRLIIFMNPSVDPQGAGWNIIQSQIAIGSGGVLGQGYLMGTQSHYRFLPEQSTDFIFSILSEEMGYVGAIVIFSLYLVIFIKTLYIIKKTKDKFGVLIASGIFGLFSYHFFVNVGMVMGIMPITGIPLLFLSYGGSSLLLSMCAVGLLMSINYRKKESRYSFYRGSK